MNAPTIKALSTETTTRCTGRILVRWFYISNWSGWQTVSKKNWITEVADMWSFYKPEFWTKADFEIVDGNKIHTVPASVIKGYADRLAYDRKMAA